MPTCFDVAAYFLTKQDEDAGDSISNLKLQKLVYYAQGFHLAMYRQPLFEERLIAWTHGPVVPELYRLYKDSGAAPIAAPSDFDREVFSGTQIELLDEVYDVYGQFSAWKLRNMTHIEPPWRDTLVNDEITHDKLREYFETLLRDQETQTTET